LNWRLAGLLFFDVKSRKSTVENKSVCGDWRAQFLVIEKMQIYRTAGTAINNDLIDVAIASGILAGAYGKHTFVLPSEWKGNASKTQNHAHIRSRLDDDEKLIFDRANEHHKDAIGIGMWMLRRITSPKIAPNLGQMDEK
jgi:hypothetical protein